MGSKLLLFYRISPSKPWASRTSIKLNLYYSAQSAEAKMISRKLAVPSFLPEVVRRVAERVDAMYADSSRLHNAVRLFDSVDKLDKAASAATVANKGRNSITQLREILEQFYPRRTAKVHDNLESHPFLAALSFCLLLANPADLFAVIKFQSWCVSRIQGWGRYF